MRIIAGRARAVPERPPPARSAELCQRVTAHSGLARGSTATRRGPRTVIFGCLRGRSGARAYGTWRTRPASSNRALSATHYPRDTSVAGANSTWLSVVGATSPVRFTDGRAGLTARLFLDRGSNSDVGREPQKEGSSQTSGPPSAYPQGIAVLSLSLSLWTGRHWKSPPRREWCRRPLWSHSSLPLRRARLAVRAVVERVSPFVLGEVAAGDRARDFDPVFGTGVHRVDSAAG
jgi:hypothetical protein